MIKFVIRDETGHSQQLVPPEQADDFADELRDKGYHIIARKKLIPYGGSVAGFSSVEAIPMMMAG